MNPEETEIPAHAPEAALRGPWTRARVEEFLRSSIVPIRLSTIGTDGWPSVVSLWYAYRAGALWCCTQQSAVTVARIEKNPRCAFEVAGDAPPYRGVRGKARADLYRGEGARVLEQLIPRYLDDVKGSFADWLRRRSDREVAIRLVPLSFSSWDYSARMPGGTNQGGLMAERGGLR